MRLSAALKYAQEQPKFFVYAILNEAGRPIYAGSTKHPERRYKQHLADLVWQQPLRQWVAANPHSFTILSTHGTKRLMLDAERMYIIEHRPAFNVLRHS